MRTLMLAALLLGACGQESSNREPSENRTPSSPPGTFRVKFETTKGDIVIEVLPEWAPIGARHFRKLVEAGYFTDIAFFRVVRDFMAQFGVTSDKAMADKWLNHNIRDDPVGAASNTRGHVTFATAGEDTRATQLFINMADNSRLDAMGFPPIGKVVSGMDVVRKLYSGYGDFPPRGQCPDPSRIVNQGAGYLKRYPKLDYLKRATIVE